MAGEVLKGKKMKLGFYLEKSSNPNQHFTLEANTVPLVGQHIYLNIISPTPPMIRKRKFRVVNVDWSITVETSGIGYRETEVQITMVEES